MSGPIKSKICPRCGATFECRSGGCWCTDLQLSPTLLEELRRTYPDCLCRACLEALAQRAKKIPLVMSWSGGKDCALALHELLTGGQYEVVALLTSVAEEFRRISHHGVREALLEAQAAALGIPLDKIYLPSHNGQPVPNAVYEQIMGDAMRRYVARGVRHVGFGDLFLEDLRAYREGNLARVGMTGVFPLWKRPTAQVARQIIDSGFKAYLACVEGKVGPGFAGRAYDDTLLRALPADIDCCGENGEFHTYVYDGPTFRAPVRIQVGAVVTRDGRYYADLWPEGGAAAAGDIPPVGTVSGTAATKARA